MSEWNFSVDLRINDPEQLIQAALAHPDAEGMSREEFLDDDGEIDINACLVVLIDPGSLPGCKIHGSVAEPLEVFSVDFGDERN